MPETKKEKSCVLFISTFPPRECGIATFTQDLATAFDALYSPREESSIAAINIDEYTRLTYSKKVWAQFPQTNRESYRRLAKEINDNHDIKLVNIQHEFGIFGGEYGSYILDFLAHIIKPVCTTFHTVLPEPDEKMLTTVRSISEKISFIVVMTKTSEEILTGKYGIDSRKIRIIPHGIHQRPYRESKIAKTELGLPTDRPILSSFGLLGPGKGIEYAIDALAEVTKTYPNVLYLIIGATHPVVLRKDGEKYRETLTDKIKALGLDKNIIFYNQYFRAQDILVFLEATDIYLSLSQNPNQAVSGTLSYALGVGRPVISTAFAHAQEILTPEIGALIGFGESRSLTQAILDLMMNQERLKIMGETAYFRTRKMTWPNVAFSYMREFISIVPEFKKRESNLPAIKIKHISHLTDDFGIFQFAERSVRNPIHGYTTDDNARALMATVKLMEKSTKPQLTRLTNIYLNFLEYVSHGGEGFLNYVNQDKSFNTERNTKEDLADAHARACYALAFTASRPYLPQEFRDRALQIFKNKFNKSKKALSPRSASFTILALFYYLENVHDDNHFSELKELADGLVMLFEETRDNNWLWFEDILSYSNGIIPEALFMAHKKTDDPRYLETATKTLDFLIQHSFEDGMCVPVGQSGWFRRGGVKEIFDQQPEEVSALVSVLKTAYEITGREKYLEKMKIAFDWFLGNNRIGQMVYDESTGGSYDGLGEDHINLNQGAESTVMYLLARLAMDSVAKNRKWL